LLGAYLNDSGERGFVYVSGERGSKDDDSWTTHAWIERDGLVVDITCDQFPDAPAAVIVSPNSDWHRCFESKSQGGADFRSLQGGGIVELSDLYRRLRAVLFP